MNRDFKCITFDVEAQRNLPEHIRRKIAEDRKRAAYRCGNCVNLQFEDAEGNGYCDAILDNTHCEEKACGHYEPKNN
jgi:hypothetical protein